jgi:hypothetical protein
MYAEFHSGKVEGRDRLEDVGVNNNLKIYVKEIDGGYGRDSFGQNEVQWRNLVNTVMNFGVA